MNRVFVLNLRGTNYQAVRRLFLDTLAFELKLGERRVVIAEPTRSDVQNDKMWALLGDVAKSVPWPVNGKRRLLKSKEWKAIFTAGLKHDQQMAAGIDGGFVMLGESTSSMTKRELSDLIELIQAFGAEHGVVWSDPAAA